MTIEELKQEVMIESQNKPKQWRLGQFVFNYIDDKYGVSRIVQFNDNVDCFYDDKNIDNFLCQALKYINNF